LAIVYLIALIAVCTALLGALAEAVWSMSRTPVWARPRHVPRLLEVSTHDRRVKSLPFVGADRRRGVEDARQTEQDKLAA
jgi:hypothetical protein